MSVRRFRAVVFDLDGTLLDTVPDSHAALNHLLLVDGLRRLSIDEIHTIVGEGAQSMLTRGYALAGKQVAPTDIDRLEQRYLEAYLADPVSHTVIYPDAVAIVKELHAAGYLMGICTNKPKLTTHIVLNKLGLAPFFSAIKCPEDVENRKPDGRHVLSTLGPLATDAGDAVFVGDSETDILAAYDAGVASVLVNWGYCHVPRDTLPADTRIDRFSQLPAALLALAARRP